MNDGNTVALRQYERDQHKSAAEAELDMEEEINRLLTTRDGILDLVEGIDSDPKFLNGLRMLLAYPNNKGGMWTSGVACIRATMERIAVNKAHKLIYGN